MSGGANSPGGDGFWSRMLHILRPKISTKIFIYFIIIALVPLVTVSFVLVTSANNQLLKNASDKQKALASDLSERVDSYLASRINLLSYQGRLYSGGTLNEAHLVDSLEALFEQNSALMQITMMQADGIQRTLIRQGDTIQSSRLDLREDELPQGASLNDTLNFMVGKAYLISIGRDANHSPQVGIGIPILKEYGEPSNDLFATHVGKQLDDLAGAIVGYYDVSTLLNTVQSVKIGEEGYAYVVANFGELVTHPDQKFLFSHNDLKETEVVTQFLENNFETKQTLSEKNREVISTPHKTRVGWAVVVQEPVESIYSSINSYIQNAATIGIIAMILSILVGLFFSRQLIRPIRQLTKGAKLFGQGEFEHTIEIKSRDEMQELATTFNRMGLSIKKLIGDLQTNNMRLIVEQSKLNNIISSVSDGIIAINVNGEIVSVNPPAAKIVNKQPQALEGKPLAEMFKWEHDGETFTPDIKTPGIHQHTDLVLKEGSTVVYVDLMVAVLENQNGNIAAIITVHDQTATRELNFMKLDFVAIAAHELRTPLTVVRGYLDILNTGQTGLSVFQLENLQKAIVGANQLRELINKLLNIARIERGDMEIFIEKLDLQKMVNENVEQHQTAAQQKEQKLVYNNTTTEEKLLVPADSASIVEVLNNLIGNAIKYTPKGGEVKVNLLIEEGFAKVEVVDNGPGVPNDMRERLFTKFYRAERSLISGSRGTGIGLFISKTIIELQNGTIGIEPDQGHGSVFFFTLPIYDAERDDEQVAKNSSGGIRGWFKKRTTR